MSDVRCALCIILMLVIVAPFARAQNQPAATQAVTVTPVPRTDEWWQQRHAAVVERLKQGGVDLLLIGDSITQGWETVGKEAFEKHYAPRRAVDLGFSGDGTQHVLWRLDNGEIDGITPKLAVVMIGTSNASTQSAEAIAAGVEAIVARLRTKLPQTKVLLLAVFPRSEKPDALREKVAATNALLAARFGSDSKGADAHVRFVDIGAKFLSPDGTISKELMPDFLHLTPRAYAIWAETIEPHVAELMK